MTHDIQQFVKFVIGLINILLEIVMQVLHKHHSPLVLLVIPFARRQNKHTAQYILNI